MPRNGQKKEDLPVCTGSGRESGRSVRKSRGGFPEVVNGQSGPYWSGAKWNPSCVWKDNYGKSVNVIPLRVDGFVNAIEFDDLGDWINFRFNLTYEALQDSRDEMKPLSELPASVCTGFRCLEFQITFVQFRILFSTSPRLTLTYFQLQEYVQVDHFSGAKRVTLTDLGGKCLRSKESFGEGEK
ncbi:hypothetical protein MG293_007891 [Ovis ammon polii]|uniref:Uncharacterized protein n=1 Tax=Ovis ammon polii TaxID=230172 RepID=A0AAD4UDA4_OVIAM|nr:hypothetical protein MG293_007891 [Ovis ammon polii]